MTTTTTAAMPLGEHQRRSENPQGQQEKRMQEIVVFTASLPSSPWL